MQGIAVQGWRVFRGLLRVKTIVAGSQGGED